MAVVEEILECHYYASDILRDRMLTRVRLDYRIPDRNDNSYIIIAETRVSGTVSCSFLDNCSGRILFRVDYVCVRLPGERDQRLHFCIQMIHAAAFTEHMRQVLIYTIRENINERKACHDARRTVSTSSDSVLVYGSGDPALIPPECPSLSTFPTVRQHRRSHWARL
jgi:hypothetical protein